MKRAAVAVLLAAALHSAAAGVDPEVDLRKAELEAASARAAVLQPAPTSNDAARARSALNSTLQRLGNQRSFVGDDHGAMAAFDELTLSRATGGASADAEDLARLASAREEDAIGAIVREAGKHRVVILNEAHHVPLHRAFAMRLARELRRIGYSWLACETFEETPFRKGYLALSDGYYSREPAFGNFLRDAKADEWQLVQYEPFDLPSGGTMAEQTAQRERGEARNLVARIFSRHPDAKVFIYVGYGHVREKPGVDDGSGPAMMAAQLRQMTGLDPLTIDQTTMMAHTDRAAEHPLYAAALRQPHETPFVLRTPDGGYAVFGSYRSAVDMQVVHPRYGVDADSGRAAWLRTLSGFHAAEAPAAMRNAEAPSYVYAYPQGQPENAVPVDVVRLTPGLPAPKLMLPDGQFRFTIQQ
ncbi:hypothetical protein FHW58_005040 [Duganella sp. 1224]|uniref:hypothetical protein n=1 Tax=Duganella sp. 1224 TaxID=2587052 RepID=UPI0015CD2A67|nr:hypothetical protein [Duganella sp. 1224]NYE63806.1 hypothetical protein [Duganella sp. 1224]